MRKDPICGMTGTIEHAGHWFCSQRCIKVFDQRAAQTTIAVVQMGRMAWWCDPWIWVPLSGVLMATLGAWLPATERVSAIYAGYLKTVAGPMLLGLLIGGVVDRFIPKEYIVKMLTGARKRVIARATLLGFLASSCSHGCLALSLELFRKGASVPAVVSFLLASPWASMSLTLILLSLFGVKGFIIMAAALLIAFLTGLIFQRLAAKGLIESNRNTSVVPEHFSIRKDMRRRWKAYRWSAGRMADDAHGVLEGMIPLGRMVLGWVQLGLVLSALSGAFIPHHVSSQWLGPSVGGLLLTLLLAAIIEVCSEGTAPLAFELYRQTGAFGNSFAFLMAGVVTDYTELGALWLNIGRRTVVWLLAVTIPMVLAVGLLLNWWVARF
ncbi:MAG: permease [Candidatus Omnitrophica bacterium]|nr:permease [Candidatus Omnitrophota bacterium]